MAVLGRGPSYIEEHLWSLHESLHCGVFCFLVGTLNWCSVPGPTAAVAHVLSIVWLFLLLASHTARPGPGAKTAARAVGQRQPCWPTPSVRLTSNVQSCLWEQLSGPPLEPGSLGSSPGPTTFNNEHEQVSHPLYASIFISARWDGISIHLERTVRIQ